MATSNAKPATINRQFLKSFRVEIDAALADLGAKYGITIHAGNASFDENGGRFTFKLEGLAEGGLTAEESAYDANAKWMGLPPRGTVITDRTGSYTAWGLKSRGDKVILMRDGKKYTSTIDKVIEIVGKQSIPV